MTDVLRYRYGRYIPFSYKMMIPYLLLVMLTDAVVGYFSYRTAVQSRSELVRSNAVWALRQIRDGVQYRMADLQAVSDSLFSSPTFQQSLQASGDRPAVYEATVRGLLPLLEASLEMTVQNARIFVYAANPAIDEIYGKLSEKIEGKSYALLSMDRIVSSGWHLELLRAREDNVWRQADTDKEMGNISLLRKLISFEDYQTEIGFLRIAVPLRDLFGANGEAVLHPDMIFRAIDVRPGDRRVLFTNGPEVLSPRDRDYMTVSERVPGTELLLEAKIPLRLLEKDAGRIRGITLLVCGLSFAAMAAMAFAVARYSGRKLMRIVSFARSFQSGEFSRRIPHAGRDEFALIASAFNRMAQSIDELIRKVYVQGLQKKEAELRALQAQMNPHFLYNTLSSINSLAHIGETRKLSEMVAGLVKFYRLALNDGCTTIAIGDEIEHVRSYLHIQAIKYASRFTVSYEVEPGILGCETVKLILQPFVENVLKHAWFEERIHIRICGRREGERIEFRIIDNGVGMVPERMRERRDGSGGYGIRNVDERIRLQYGDEYGVRIFSGPGIGSTVRIVIPCRPYGPDVREG